MGYYTSYSGQFDIEPALNKYEYLRLAQVVEFWNSARILKAACDDVFDPQLPELTVRDKATNPNNYGLSFNLFPTTIESNDGEVKGYEDKDALVVVAKWLADNDHTLTGSVTWHGSGEQDSGVIYAASGAKPDGAGGTCLVNRVEFIEDVVTNPGPSWESK